MEKAIRSGEFSPIGILAVLHAGDLDGVIALEIEETRDNRPTF
jgi:hypothetical protein